MNKKHEDFCLLFTVSLRGEFRIVDHNGLDRTPRGQKASALLAMLLVSQEHARARIWLRQHLWSDRTTPGGLSSLRQCLSEIRKVFADCPDAISIDRHMVRLSRQFFRIDSNLGEFLESLSIQDPAFQTWLNEMRRHGDYASAPADGLAGAMVLTSATDEQAHIQSSCPTVSVEPDPVSRSTVPMIRALHDMRTKLTTFRWMSVLADAQSVPKAEYVVRLSQDPVKDLVGRVSLLTARGTLLWSIDLGSKRLVDRNLPFLDAACGIVAVLISNAEEQRAADAPEDDNLRNLLWRGRWHLNHMTRKDAKEADSLFAKAEKLAPYDANVAIDLAYAKVARAWVFRLDRPALEDVIAQAKRATARVPTDARGFYNLGTALCFNNQLEAARIAIDEAIRLCPNMAMAWMQQGCNLLGEGRFEDAIPVYHRCLTLGQFERRRYIPECGLAIAHLFLGDNENAVDIAERAIGLRPGYWYAHMIHGVAHRRMGRMAEARRSFATMRRIFPKVSQRDIEWLPNQDRAALRRLVRDAGLAK